MNESVVDRIDRIFQKEIRYIGIERIKKGKSERVLGTRRLTKAIRKLPYWEEIKKDLIELRIDDDRYQE